MDRKIILVTGGAGFIGSNIVDAYIREGYDVCIVDNLLTGSETNLNPKTRFYNVDITNFVELEKIFEKEKPEIVSHHAAIGEVTKSVADPNRTMQTNVIGTMNVIILFLKYTKSPERRFIFASSGGTVYGEAHGRACDENTSLQPVSAYGLSKVFCEDVIKYYSRLKGLDYIIFRYSNVYGPRQSPKAEAGVVAIFTGLIRKGERPIIYGDGTKTREYTYVDDIVDANIRALTDGHNEIYNLAWGDPKTDQQMYDVLRMALDFHFEAQYAPLRAGECLHVYLDPRKAFEQFGWEPTISLEEGITRTIATIQ